MASIRTNGASNPRNLITSALGPAESSPINSGPGVTTAIGKNASEIIEILTDPAIMRPVFGDSWMEAMSEYREMVKDVGYRGAHTGTPGISKDNEIQYIGRMPIKMFVLLQWVDPTLFEDEKRLESVLKRIGTHISQGLA